MSPNETSSQHTQMKTKSNQGRRTQKRQQFKKKYRPHNKSIPDQTAHQFQQPDIIEFITEDQTLSTSSSFIKKKCYPIHADSTLDPTIFLMDYSKFTNDHFKELLSTIMVTDMDRNSWNKLLDNEETFIFIRQLTELINKLNFFKLQDEQWTYYYNLGMNEGIWTKRVSRSMATINSMCNNYGCSKILIEQRNKKYKKNLENIQINIDEHIKQMSASINTDQLVSIITALVYQDQYELRIELERRRHMLKFDANEHKLVHAFYNLKPRQTEIHSAKIIWKTIRDEQVLRYELALFKAWLSSSKSNPLTLCTFRDLGLTRINDIFTHLIFDRNLSSANSTDQFLDDIIKQTVSTIETIIERYIQKVQDEKTKILKKREKFNKPPSVDTIVTAIENRQMNMVQRAQYNTDQTLKIIRRTNINEINSTQLKITMLLYQYISFTRSSLSFLSYVDLTN